MGVLPPWNIRKSRVVACSPSDASNTSRAVFTQTGQFVQIILHCDSLTMYHFRSYSVNDDPSTEAITMLSRLVLARLITRLNMKDEITQDLNFMLSTIRESEKGVVLLPDTIAAAEEFLEILKET